MAKKPTASSIEIEKLEKEQRKLGNKLRKARIADSERRSIGTRRDALKDAEERFEDLIVRQTGYDTNEKGRVFGFGAFDGGLDGSLRWVRLSSVYSIEVELPHVDSTNQKIITMLKTVDGPVDVSQSPSEVMDEFVRVRFAYEAETIREMQSEQIRIENKVAERKDKAKKKAAKKSGDAPAGPDFKGVSDRVSGPPDDEDAALFEPDDEVPDSGLGLTLDDVADDLVLDERDDEDSRIAPDEQNLNNGDDND